MSWLTAWAAPNVHARNVVLTSSVATGRVATPVPKEYQTRKKLINTTRRVLAVSGDVLTVEDTAKPSINEAIEDRLRHEECATTTDMPHNE